MLPEEEKISETQLAKQLNVSRTSLCGTELKQSDEFSRYDQYFHTLIYNIAGSERLSKLSGLIQDARMRIYLAREWLVEEFVDNFLQQHKMIAEAVIEKDPDKAEKMAHDHIDFLVDLLDKRMKE